MNRINIHKILNLYNQKSNYTNFKFIQIKRTTRIEKTETVNYNFQVVAIIPNTGQIFAISQNFPDLISSLGIN